MAVSLVVFDLDGTLVDSRRDIADAANALLAENGATPLPERQIGRMVGDGASVLIARAFAAVGRPVPPNALARFIELYDAHLIDHTRAYDGIPAVLQALAPRVQLAVLTNKPLQSARGILEALNLSSYFPADRVIGGDGPLPRKPDPAGLLHLITAAGSDAASALLVGDSIVDWRTAGAGGVRICIASYGFGFETFPPEQLRGDEWIARQPMDLLNWV